MDCTQEIIDYATSRWPYHAEIPERPPVREEIGRGIALPVCVGFAPYRYSSFYLRRAGSGWVVEANGPAAHGEIHGRAIAIASELTRAGH